MAKVVRKVKDLDPYDIDARALKLMDIMLSQMLKKPNDVTLTEMTRGLAAITRARYVQVMTATKIQPEDENAGATARKYASQFQANAARGGAKRAGPRAVPAPDPADELGNIFDDDEEAERA